MSKLVLVSPEGRVLNDEKTTTPANEVEQHQDEPIWVIAAREAEKQSTKKHQQGNDYV